jgi:hypothetical protein
MAAKKKESQASQVEAVIDKEIQVESKLLKIMSISELLLLSDEDKQAFRDAGGTTTEN